MITNQAELLFHRRQTAAYLRAESVDIALERRVWETTDTGGRKVASTSTLPPQRFRLVPFKRRLTHVVVNTPDGKVTDSSFQMVGSHTADIQKEDRFQLDGGWYEIESVEPNREFRTLCDVRYRGQERN